jgi:hypothetical protein
LRLFLQFWCVCDGSKGLITKIDQYDWVTNQNKQVARSDAWGQGIAIKIDEEHEERVVSKFEGKNRFGDSGLLTQGFEQGVRYWDFAEEEVGELYKPVSVKYI